VICSGHGTTSIDIFYFELDALLKYAFFDLAKIKLATGTPITMRDEFCEALKLCYPNEVASKSKNISIFT